MCDCILGACCWTGTAARRLPEGPQPGQGNRRAEEGDGRPADLERVIAGRHAGAGPGLTFDGIKVRDLFVLGDIHGPTARLKG